MTQDSALLYSKACEITTSGAVILGLVKQKKKKKKGRGVVRTLGLKLRHRPKEILQIPYLWAE